MNPARSRRLSLAGVAILAGLVALMMLASAAVPLVGPPADAFVPADESATHSPDLPGWRVAAPGVSGDDAREAAQLAPPARELPVRIHVRRGCGPGSDRFTGDLQVAADGVVVFDGELYDPMGLRLLLPANTASLQFRAANHEVLVHRLLPPGADGWSFRVVLVPTSHLKFCLRGVPDGWFGEVNVHLNCGDLRGNGKLVRGDDGVWATVVPWPANHKCDWHIAMTGCNAWGGKVGVADALAPGEHRRIEVVSDSPRRHRVVGLPAESLSSLVVTYSDYEHKLGAWGGAFKVRTDGSFDLFGGEPAVYHLHTVEESVVLTPTRTAEETLLRPAEPLVAIGVLDCDGEVLATCVLDSNGRPRGMSRDVHIYRQASLPERVFARSGGGDLLTLHVPDSRPLHEVLWLSAEPVAAPATIMVHVAGDPPEGEDTLSWRICASGGEPKQVVRSSVVHRAEVEVPEGTYKVSWQIAGHEVVIVPELTVSSGQQVQLESRWPRVSTWQGHVVGFEELPLLERHRFVMWRDSADPETGRNERADQHGEFSVTLAKGSVPRIKALHSGFGKSRVRVAYDEAEKTIAVHVVRRQRQVVVRVQGAEPWCVMLGVPDGSGFSRILHRRSSADRRPIPMYDDEVLHGALLQGGKTVAWFEMDALAPEFVVQKSAGRVVEVSLADGIESKNMGLVGPQGQAFRSILLVPGASQSLFVPDGASRIWLERSALPVPTGDRWVLK